VLKIQILLLNFFKIITFAQILHFWTTFFTDPLHCVVRIVLDADQAWVLSTSKRLWA